MSGIGVVLNPFSKRFKKNPVKLEHMAFIIGDKASCKPTEDLDDLYRVADEFKTRDIDVLAISGGDGTIHCTLTTFLKVYGDKPLPKIVFLKGGTMNIVASSLGVKGTTEKIMSDLLLRYHEDKSFETKKLRLMKINDAYGCLFGMGLIYNFMLEYYKHPKPNPFIAAKTLTHAVTSGFLNGQMAQRLFKQFDAKILVDGKELEFANFCGVFTGTVAPLPFNFKVFYSMFEQNEEFHYIAMSLPPRELVKCFRNLYRGKPSLHPGLMDGSTSKLEIITEEPMPYTIDGDLLEGETHFVIEPGPEITVLV